MAGVVKKNRLDLSEDATYELNDTNSLFAPGVNLIPAPNSVQGTRHLYGNKFFEQALPLQNREAPLVRSLNNETGRSWDWEIGKHLGIVRADDQDEGAVVEKVTDDEIQLRRADGTKTIRDLYNKFPNNRNTLSQSYAKVKAGDTVKAGQTLAPTNFTDDDGRMALGLNARIALVPFKGHSMDDAVVISSSFANRLRSMHAATVDREHDDLTKTGKNHFVALFNRTYDRDQLERIDDDGLPKVGEIFQPGDPLILQTRPRTFSSNKMDLSRLSKAQRFSRKDGSIKWDGKHPAKVIEVAKTRGKGHKVLLEYAAGVEPGDKLTLRPGQKMTVSKIIADEKMPRNEEGTPLEMLVNQLGLPSRVNAETYHELMLGKIARKTGKPYVLPQFLPKGQVWTDFVRNEMEKHGIEDSELTYDPDEDITLEQPLAVGEAYVMKLHHLADKKMTARGQKGYCYDEETEVLTETGWKLWEVVTPEDRLCCPDVLTGKSVYARPLELIQQDYEGDMLHYTSRYLDFKVTPEHRMWAGPCKRGEFHFEEILAENLAEKSRWSVPQYGFALSEAGNPRTKSFPAPTLKRCRKDYSEPLVVDFLDYARLLGWWLAEGTVQSSGSGHRTYIWQSESANPSNWKEIGDLLERITGKRPMAHRAKGASVGLRSDDPRLGEFLRNYGDSCEVKRVPEDLIFAGEESVKAFLGAYCRGDGNLKGGEEIFAMRGSALMAHSASKLMLEDIQRMLLHVGLGAQIQLAKPKGTSFRFAGRREGVTLLDSWGLHIHLYRRNAFIAGKKVTKRNPRYKGGWERAPYEGKIYCARSVTGWLVVRRNGKVLVAGNSIDMQPLKGKGQSAQRMSGLELGVLRSSGAWGVQKESVLLRGEMRDEYWKRLRANRNPGTLDKPFVWEKFRHLLQGAGINTKDMGKGTLRLAPMTNAELENRDPIEVLNEGIVDLKNFEPKPGGLFDPRMVREGRWGFVPLKRPTVNPAYEDTVRTLLGLTKDQYEELLDEDDEVA